MSRRTQNARWLISALSIAVVLAPFTLPVAAPSSVPAPVLGWPPAASFEMQPEEIAVPQDLIHQQALVRGHAGARAFTGSHRTWKATVDPFSGSVDRAFGDGIDLDEPTGRGFLARYAGLLAAGAMGNGSELVANEKASRPLGDSGARVLTFDQRKDGLPVLGAGVSLGVRDGRVVLVSTRALGPVTTSSRPRLGEAEALVAVARHAGLSDDGLALAKEPELAFYPRLESRGAAQVLRHHLVWRLQVKPPDAAFWQIWNAWVDAHDGRLLVFYPEARTAGSCTADPSQAKATARGGVRPNRADDTEVILNLPFAQVLANGKLVSADLNGRFPFTGGGSSGTLSGDNFRMHCDNCTFPLEPAAAGTASGDVDYGTGGGSSGPPVFGNGLSTPADRTGYFHLHQARQLMAKWDTLPFDEIDVFVNLDATCNAFSLSYMLGFFLAGNGCRNTGEIRDVMQHELGHTWDRFDGNDITNGGMSEWKADMFAVAMGGDACMGESFHISTGFPSPGCSGVRDINEKTTNKGIISIATNPCSGEVHCVGEIPGQASWHLLNNLMTGTDYITGAPLPAGNPALSPEQAKWIFERLILGGGPPMQVLNPAAAGVSIYDAIMLMDDNDANLSNGTPHAAYINAAFAHHGLAETPQVADSAACAPLSDPIVTATLDRDPATGLPLVRVTWTPVGGATNFDVYRNTSPGDAFLPLQRNVAAGPVVDSGVQTGATYRYFVAAVRRTGCAEISPGANVATVVVNPPDLKVLNATFAETPSASDGDGLLEPGERVAVHVTLNETSNISGASNVTATLVSASAASPVVAGGGGGPVSFGAVPAGGSATGASDFEVLIGPSEPCGGSVHLTLSASGNEGCWLDSFNLPIDASVGCAESPSAFVEVTPGSLHVVSLSGDADGIADNCEITTAAYEIRNGGTLASGPAVSTVTTTHPGVVLSPVPSCSAAGLAGGASATCQFTFSLGGASMAGVPFTLSATSSTNPAPSVLTATLGAEKNAPVFATQSFGFEGSLQGWTAKSFALSSLRAFAGTQSVRAGSIAIPNICASLTSPTFLLNASSASTLSLRAYVDIEPFSDQFYDRANVHIVDVDSGVHTVVSPASGMAYNASGDPTAGLCHDPGEVGWAGFLGGFNLATFDLSAFAGRRVRIEVNYGTDELDDREGIYIDDVSITNAAIEPPDTQSDTCTVPEVSSSAAPVQLQVNQPAAGQTRFTWQDLGPGFQYNVYAGTIGSYYSHGAAPVACQGLGNGITCNGTVCALDKANAALPGGSLYFLVTGTAFGREGTSGFASAGPERDPSQSTCLP